MNNPGDTFKKEELTVGAVTSFQRIIRRHYRASGRKLPWRDTREPYRILVSEFMLQQTQVERVIGKYGPFLEAFPDFSVLAAAHLRDVLAVWQGLGYNRRAVALHRTAQRVVLEFNGRLPDSVEILVTLPGIGGATAGALAAFAYGKPAVFIETNIRRVFIHFFFPDRNGIKDGEIFPLVQRTLDRESVREWYYALMDYGAMLKKLKGNPNRRSAHHHVQGPFEGSDRQIRGLILRALVTHETLSLADLVKTVGKSDDRVVKLANQLVEEGFLEGNETKLCISGGWQTG